MSRSVRLAMFLPPLALFVLAVANCSFSVAQDDASKAADTKAATKAKADTKAKTDAEKKDADAKAPAKKAEDAAKSNDPAQVDFEKKLGEWKELLAELRELQIQYKLAKPEDRPPLEKQFEELKERGEALASGLVDAAAAAYKAAPNDNGDVSSFLVSRADSDIQNDLYEEGIRLANLLSENNFPNASTYELSGIGYFVLGDYDAAEKALKTAKEKKSISRGGEFFLEKIPEYREFSKKEKELEAAEAKANDLPRVLIKTDRGDITLELFENEAPNTVANFVNLVEKGYYNGLLFHRVIRGFVAQGGDPKGNGGGGPGYRIADECYQENHRNHFRGSLSMAKSSSRDSGGSQFFLTFRPTPHLNGMHTVFGRVIDGWDVLRKLEQTGEGREPDKIIEAKVLRKRNHEYVPKTLPEEAA